MSVSEWVYGTAVDSKEIVSVGIARLGSCSHLLRYVCGTSPLSAQWSATVVQLRNDLAPSV